MGTATKRNGIAAEAWRARRAATPGSIICAMLLAVGVSLLTSCGSAGAADPVTELLSVDGGSIASGVGYRKLDFGDADILELHVSNLAGTRLLLAKANRGSSTVSASSAGTATLLSASSSARSATGTSALDRPASTDTVADGRPIILEHQPSTTWQPAVAPVPAASLPSARGVSSASTVTFGSPDLSVGATETFYVDYPYDANGDGSIGSSEYAMTGVAATLRAVSSYAYIWVADTGDSVDGDVYTSFEMSNITSAEWTLLAGAFDDIIRDANTSVFGYERGGAPDGEDNSDGGVDGNQYISILIYDIDFDAATTSGILGYFWSKDEYADGSAALGGQSGFSNEKEMFYLDAPFLAAYPYMLVSTLAHEYQHMINWNRNVWERGESVPTWLNELCSLAAEDLLEGAFEDAYGTGSPKYLATRDGPRSRLWDFNGGYDYVGLTTGTARTRWRATPTHTSSGPGSCGTMEARLSRRRSSTPIPGAPSIP